MIAKIEAISHTLNALDYCERGGELIYSFNCIGNASEIYKQMESNNSLNDHCKKPTFHAKIRISPEDIGILKTQDFLDIALDYAKTIGFELNPYAVYIHEEGTDKEHIHIVASRIKENNTAVTESYTRYKNLDFCRKIEEKYNLRRVKRVLETVKEQKVFISEDARQFPLVKKIDQAIEYSVTLKDFVFHLEQNVVNVQIGRGIGFTDEKGVYFKGSDLGRDYTLSSITKRLEKQVIIEQANRNDRAM
jgi:hypothetical protein